jgi:serine/threonine protein kinase
VRPGTVLAEKYLLESKLGAGNFGTVYRGKHLNLEQGVAVKILETNITSQDQALARFKREGISACRVKHPNAVSVLDFGVTEGGVAYLVMELLEGWSLLEEMNRRRILSPNRCGEILTPICDVLSDVHAAGIVHRDIKPANVFLHRDRHCGEIVKVLDFGIAKLVGDVTGAQNLTVDGSILGTPTYMAPERINNLPYDGRADVYSLGIMVYEMLVGHPPFQAKDLMAVAMQHVTEQPRPLRALDPRIPPAVEAVIMRTIIKDMHKRPTATVLSQWFGQALAYRQDEQSTRPTVVHHEQTKKNPQLIKTDVIKHEIPPPQQRRPRERD